MGEIEVNTDCPYCFQLPASRYRYSNKILAIIGIPSLRIWCGQKAALVGPQRLLRIIQSGRFIVRYPFAVFIEPTGTAAFADIPDEIAGISRDIGLGQSQMPGAVQTKVSHVCLRNERICYPIKG